MLIYKKTKTSEVAYGDSNTGDGVLSGQASTIVGIETVTLTCTAVIANSGTFSVVGNKSGIHTDATVGSAYNVDGITFTIGDGVIDWLLGDIITIDFNNTSNTTGAKASVLQHLPEPFQVRSAQCRLTGCTAFTFSLEGNMDEDLTTTVYDLVADRVLTAGEITAEGYIENIIAPRSGSIKVVPVIETLGGEYNVEVHVL